MDIVDFLKARLDEDEAAAKACAGAPWVECVSMVQVDPVAIRDAHWQYGQMGYVGTIEHDYDRVHIARHDPARVLRGVEAKRRIANLHHTETHLRFHGEPQYGYLYWCDICHVPGDQPGRNWCETLRLLASEFSDHPDYDEGWAP